MIATVIRSVNSRYEPSTGARKASPKLEGSIIEITGLISGETYRGNDLWFVDKQGLHYTSHAINIGPNQNLLTPYIDFTALWSRLGSTNIKVGIYDSGVTKNEKLFGNRVNQLNHGDTEINDHHADYMAAIIAGGDFTSGYFGILPTASIFSYRSVQRGSVSIVKPDDLINALKVFIGKGVDIINISMRSDEDNDTFAKDQELQQLLDTCRLKQIAVVACTGNNGEKSDGTFYYPARYSQLYSVGGCNLIGLPSPEFYSCTNLWTGVNIIAPADPVFSNDFYKMIGTDRRLGTSVSTAITTAVFGAVKIRNRVSNSNKNSITAINDYIARLQDFPKDPAYGFITATSFKIIDLLNLKTL